MLVTNQRAGKIRQLNSELHRLQHRHSEFGAADQSSYTQAEYGRESPMEFRASNGNSRGPPPVSSSSGQNGDMPTSKSVRNEIQLEELAVSMIRRDQGDIKVLEEHIAQLDTLRRTRPLVQFVTTSKSTWHGPALLSTFCTMRAMSTPPNFVTRFMPSSV
jgi:hypothetical protein